MLLQQVVLFKTFFLLFNFPDEELLRRYDNSVGTRVFLFCRPAMMATRRKGAMRKTEWSRRNKESEEEGSDALCSLIIPMY